jgi:hypothetical protein
MIVIIFFLEEAGWFDRWDWGLGFVGGVGGALVGGYTRSITQPIDQFPPPAHRPNHQPWSVIDRQIGKPTCRTKSLTDSLTYDQTRHDTYLPCTSWRRWARPRPAPWPT